MLQKKRLKAVLMTLIAAFFFLQVTPAMAQTARNHLTPPRVDVFGEGGDTTALQTAEMRSESAYIYIKRMTYIYSGVGVIGLVILAVFGRFQWKWFIALVGGLFVLAGAQQLVFFLN